MKNLSRSELIDEVQRLRQDQEIQLRKLEIGKKLLFAVQMITVILAIYLSAFMASSFVS